MQLQTGQEASELAQGLKGRGIDSSRGWHLVLRAPNLPALPPSLLSRNLGRGSHPPVGQAVVRVGPWVWLRRSAWGLHSFSALLSNAVWVPWSGPSEAPPHPEATSSASRALGWLVGTGFCMLYFILPFPANLGAVTPRFTVEETDTKRS